MPKVKLGDVATEYKGKFISSAGEIPAVGLEHLEPREMLLSDWTYDTENTFNKPFLPGQVLFGRRRAYQQKAAMAPCFGICSGDITVIKAKEDKIVPELLPFVIQNERLFNFAIKHSAGSLSPRVKWAALKEFEFKLPNIGRQKEITKVLWSLYNTRQAYKKLLEKTDELVKSQFIEMFGAPGSDEKGWGLATLGDCCEINPQRPKKMDKSLEYSFVAMPSVSEKGVVDTSICRPYAEVCKGFTYFAENDVLFAKITPCMENGKGGVAIGLKNKAGFGSTEFHVLRPIIGGSNPYWLYILTMFSEFRSDAEKSMTGAGGQRRVPVRFFDNYKISCPPIELQNQFELIVHQSDKSKFTLNAAIGKLDTLYKKVITENLG